MLKLASACLMAPLCLLVTTAWGQCDPQDAGKLTASDAANSAEFGFAVGAANDTIAVGAHFHPDLGARSGAGYIFDRAGDAWVERAKLLASDGAAEDRFGESAAIDGDFAVFGARGVDGFTGAAYVFARSGDDWSEQAKLTPTTAANVSQFGLSVAISGDTIVVGATGDDHAGSSSGAAYVFVRTGDEWTQQQKLTAADARRLDVFGRSVSISGGTIIVGAPGKGSDSSRGPGAAYVFVRSNDVWVQESKVTVAGAGGEDQYGFAVAISGDTAVVGNDSFSGAPAHVFVRSAGAWSHQSELVAAGGPAGDSFGSAVAIDGDTALIGAFLNDDVQSDDGAAYLFLRTGDEWSEVAQMLPLDNEGTARMGMSVALSGQTAVAGAPTEGQGSFPPGAAYVFELNCGGDCPPDLNGDGVLDVDDFHLFLDLFAAGDAAADVNGDGHISIDDFFDYLDLFAAGC